jgi:hypothetical protein
MSRTLYRPEDRDAPEPDEHDLEAAEVEPETWEQVRMLRRGMGQGEGERW